MSNNVGLNFCFAACLTSPLPDMQAFAELVVVMLTSALSSCMGDVHAQSRPTITGAYIHALAQALTASTGCLLAAMDVRLSFSNVASSSAIAKGCLGPWMHPFILRSDKVRKRKRSTSRRRCSTTCKFNAIVMKASNMHATEVHNNMLRSM